MRCWTSERKTNWNSNPNARRWRYECANGSYRDAVVFVFPDDHDRAIRGGDAPLLKGCLLDYKLPPLVNLA